VTWADGYTVISDCFTNKGHQADQYPWTNPVNHPPNRHYPLHMKVTAAAVMFNLPWILPRAIWVYDSHGQSNYLSIKARA
jgi:hypothetical protein